MFGLAGLRVRNDDTITPLIPKKWGVTLRRARLVFISLPANSLFSGRNRGRFFSLPSEIHFLYMQMRYFKLLKELYKGLD